MTHKHNNNQNVYKKHGMMKELMECDNVSLVDVLWKSDPKIFNMFISSSNSHEARDKLFNHLNDIERHIFNIYSDMHFKDKNILERNNAKECIKVFKNILRTENEKITNFSALKVLYKLAKERIFPEDLNRGFISEFIFLFKGINCNSGIYDEKEAPQFVKLTGLEASLERTRVLNNYSSNIKHHLKRYKTGLDTDLIERRQCNKRVIQEFFLSGESDWRNYKWHMKHVVDDIDILSQIVDLSHSEIRGLECATKHNIPFQITPYYLSLFDRKNTGEYDHAI